MTDRSSSQLHDLLAALVRIDSTSGTPGEQEALAFVADWLQRAVGEAGTISRVPEVGPTAAVLLTPPDATRELLLFSGHIDVVPVGDKAAWSHDPFAANIVDGRMIGRGSSDMKSGLAAAMMAVVELLHDGVAVGLLVTTGEEIGCRGASIAVNAVSELSVGAVIVPESTSGEVVLGHRGALWLRVQTKGIAAHGSTPERGVNAIEKAAFVINRVPDMPRRSHPQLGEESANVGTIRAGAVPNIVPDHCEMQVDLRIVDDVGPLLSWWQERPEVSEVSVELDLAPVWTRREHPWLRELSAPFSEHPASYFTDASVLVRAIAPDTPVVVWGPGDPRCVHTVNESIRIADVDTAWADYLSTGHRWGAR